MSTLAPVQLSNPGPGRRYSDAEREAAFLVFCGDGRQNFTTTANLTGVHRQSLMKWAEDDGWVERINGAGTALVSSVELAYAMFPMILKAAANEWLRLLHDPKANDNAKVKLIEMAYGMHGMIVPKQSMAVVQHLTDQGGKTTVSLKDLVSLDPDELERWTGQDGDEPEGE